MPLDPQKVIDYISEVEESVKREDKSTGNYPRHRLLMIGGCDLDNANKYLRTDFEVDKEFNTVINGHEIRTSDTLQLVYAKELDGFLLDELCANLPFMDASITYATKLYTGKYNVIVISLVDDFIRGVYQRKNDTYYVTWGSYWSDEKELERHFRKEELKYLQENFTFIGREPVEVFKDNIEKIICSVGTECRLILINGTDIDVSDWIGQGRVQRNIEMDLAIDEVLLKYPQVGLVDMRKIVVSREQLPQKDNRHYDRQTYYRMAQEILRLSKGYITENMMLDSVASVQAKEFTGKVKRKVKKWGGYSYLEEIDNLYVYHPEKIHRKDIIASKEYKPVRSLDESIVKIIQGSVNTKVLLPEAVDKGIIEKVGLVEFEDFICEEYANKQLTIIYGNCHTSVISQYLKNCEEFNKDHYLYPIKLIHTIKDKSYFDEPIFRYCDIFIHQSIQLGNRYGAEFASQVLIRKMPNTCTVIAIPNVYRLPMCFFPQYSWEPAYLKRDGSSVFFRDESLDELIRKGVSKKETIKKYWEQEYPDDYLDRLLEQFFSKVQTREKDWDIKCLDYIKKNYQKVQLFYDPNHPTNAFLLYIVKELLKYLEIEFDEEKLIKTDVDLLTGYEMPILPYVKQHFHMSFPNPREFREKSWNKVKFGKLSYNDYIRQYLSCIWQNNRVPAMKRFDAHMKWYIYKFNNIIWKLTRKR